MTQVSDVAPGPLVLFIFIYLLVFLHSPVYINDDFLVWCLLMNGYHGVLGIFLGVFG
jgi:hypothetical protein